MYSLTLKTISYPAAVWMKFIMKIKKYSYYTVSTYYNHLNSNSIAIFTVVS